MYGRGTSRGNRIPSDENYHHIYYSISSIGKECIASALPASCSLKIQEFSHDQCFESLQVYYYSSPNSGLCAPVDKNTPSWVEEYYTDWTECCKVGWVFEKCMKEAPPGAVISVTDNIMPTTTPKILYYAIPTSGMCEEVGESTPSWMVESDFTESFSDCCKNKSWNTDRCLAQGVSTELLTPEPTIQETPEPSSRPSTFVPGPTSIPSRHPATNQPISSEPTRSPMLIDSYQTSCDAALWHPSADYSMCSNRYVPIYLTKSFFSVPVNPNKCLLPTALAMTQVGMTRH